MISEVEKVKMKSLSSMSTSTFRNCIINEFDAPNLNEITADKYITFSIGKKNF